MAVNERRYISIYNTPLKDNSDLTYSVIDYKVETFPNIIVRMQRYYPLNHTWIYVQDGITDKDGKTIFDIIENTVDYRFMFYDLNDNLLDYTSNSINFVCTSGLCDIKSQIFEIESGETIPSSYYTYNNVTGIVTVYWNDPSAMTTSVRTTVSRDTMTGDYYICDSTSTAYSGSYACNITGYTGNMRVSVSSCYSQETVKATYYFNVFGQMLSSYISFKDSAFWVFVVSITMIGVGLAVGSLSAVLIYFMFGLFFLSVLGISTILTVPFLTLAAIFSIILNNKIKNG